VNVLLVPLDWGLGHATRCIPLISSMLDKGWTVCLAGEGKTLALLKEEFPSLECIPLQGYRVNYPRSGNWFTPWMLFQSPKIFSSILREHRWLKRLLKTRRFDLVISDNRYGLHHESVPCIILTHQLHIVTGWGPLADRVIRAFSTAYIRKFTQCWIPDAKENGGIAGRLSHPEILPRNARYIGPLSRLQPIEGNTSNEILITLSGPEPQRTILEEKLIAQATQLPHRFLIVRGLPHKDIVPPPLQNIRFINHLDARDLSREMSAARGVICRSGYSSVMDLIRMGKPAILIPTPGQTEQEHIARHVAEKGWFLTVEQSRLNLSAALDALQLAKCSPPAMDFNPFKQVLGELSTQ